MSAPTTSGFPHLADDLARVRTLVTATVAVAEERMHEPCGSLIRNAGRLFRPTLVLTSAYPFAPDGPADDTVVRAAAVVELLHVATLYHDDLCDKATTRRGLPTVNALHGDTIALLCGDYLLACCTELLHDLGAPAVLLFAHTLKALCSGQFLETVDEKDPARTEKAYYASITGKTAKLMSTSAALGALQAGADEQHQKVMADYGHHLGMAFQVWDDLMDLWTSVDTGKPRFTDLRNGVYTLPVILGLRAAPDRLRPLLGGDGLTDADCTEVLAVLEECGARDRALAVAKGHVVAALDSLAELTGHIPPDVPGRLVAVARALMPEVEQLLSAAIGRERSAG